MPHARHTETTPDTTETCKHYWIIQEAHGPVSPGVCQHCKETREFKNYVEVATWGERSRATGKSLTTRQVESDRVFESDPDVSFPEDKDQENDLSENQEDYDE